MTEIKKSMIDKEFYSKVKNVIFDVGDVLFDYRWKEMLVEHGLKEGEAQRIGDELFEDELWTQLDLEIVDREEVINEFAEKYPEDAETIRWFLDHGELMSVPRLDVWQKFHQLKKLGYHMYLLSNYSSNLFAKHTRGATFLEDIEGMVVSYQVHMMKPDPEIYQYLLGEYHLNPKECMFFDDREKNTDAAIQLGIRSVTITSKEVLLQQMDQLIKQREYVLEEKAQ